MNSLPCAVPPPWDLTLLYAGIGAFVLGLFRTAEYVWRKGYEETNWRDFLLFQVLVILAGIGIAFLITRSLTCAGPWWVAGFAFFAEYLAKSGLEHYPGAELKG